MKVDAFLVNSFTAEGKGGNPAGVVLNADKLSHAQKQTIAQTLGYSETAFVTVGHDVDFELSFFTTTDEVDFCGHATLAAFSTMYNEGIITAGQYIQRTKAGVLQVVVECSGHVVMTLQQPKYLGVFGYGEIAPLIGLDEQTLATTGLPAEVISTGLPDVIVPVPLGYLDRIQLNENLLTAFCKKHNLVGLHAFELCEQGSGLTASCRNFAPLFGIPEESATGSSSGALACYLTRHIFKAQVNHYVFEQGRAMNCTSLITASVECHQSDVVEVRVGGFAKAIGKQLIAL